MRSCAHTGNESSKELLFMVFPRGLQWENKTYELKGLPRCKKLQYFFFVSLAHVGAWLLFNGLLALLFTLF